MAFFDNLKQKLATATADLEKTAMAAASELQKKTNDTISEVRKKAPEMLQSAQKSTKEHYAKTSEAVGTAIKDGSEWASDVWNNKIPSREQLEEWAAGAGDEIKGLADDFDAGKMWDKIASSATKAGQELVVMVLTMYYTIEEKFKNKK